MKLIELGNYSHHAEGSLYGDKNRGAIYSVKGIAPCLCAGMGGGGNLVPTILIEERCS